MDILEKITRGMHSDEEPSYGEESALVVDGDPRLSAQNPAFFGGYSLSGKEVLEALKESGVLAELSSHRMIPEDASRKNDEEDRYVHAALDDSVQLTI